MGSSALDAVDSALMTRSHILTTLEDNLFKSQTAMKAQADKKRKDRIFTVGEWVLLCLQPYRQLTVARRSSHKLAQKYYGPYQILERIGEVSYRLQLPESSRIHNVFHVSLLKPFHADKSPSPQPLPVTTTNGPPIYLPTAMVGKRTIWRQGQEVSQVLIQWEGLPLADATWEDEFHVVKQGSQDTKVTTQPSPPEKSDLLAQGSLPTTEVEENTSEGGGEGEKTMPLAHQQRLMTSSELSVSETNLPSPSNVGPITNPHVAPLQSLPESAVLKHNLCFSPQTPIPLQYQPLIPFNQMVHATIRVKLPHAF